MYPTHYYYGHKHVLGTYLGRIHSLPPIVAHLQHGWQYDDPFHETTRLHPRLPKLCWSTHNAAVLRATGAGGVLAIGAPFAYLDSMLGHAARPGEGTLVYPFHSARDKVLAGDVDRFADAIVEHEASERVTVCLYYRDYEKDMRRAYEERGWEVICHGPREDPAFLLRQWTQIARHRRVVTNRVASALWYGGLLGRHIEVYGEIVGSRGEDERRWFDQLQRERWPGLFSGGVAGDAAREIARVELGAENVRSPEELGLLLGWTGKRAVVGRPVRAAMNAIRRNRPRPVTKMPEVVPDRATMSG